MPFRDLRLARVDFFHPHLIRGNNNTHTVGGEGKEVVNSFDVCLIDIGACVSEVKLSSLFVRMHVLSHCGNAITVPCMMRTQSCRIRLTRAYCKLQKLLPLAKLMSKHASWHLMPSVTEARRGTPPGAHLSNSSTSSIDCGFHHKMLMPCSAHMLVKFLCCTGCFSAQFLGMLITTTMLTILRSLKSGLERSDKVYRTDPSLTLGLVMSYCIAVRRHIVLARRAQGPGAHLTPSPNHNSMNLRRCDRPPPRKGLVLKIHPGIEAGTLAYEWNIWLQCNSEIGKSEYEDWSSLSALVQHSCLPTSCMNPARAELVYATNSNGLDSSPSNGSRVPPSSACLTSQSSSARASATAFVGQELSLIPVWFLRSEYIFMRVAPVKLILRCATTSRSVSANQRMFIVSGPFCRQLEESS